MTTPNTGDIVTIDYVLRKSDGEVVSDTQQQGGPQDIELGNGQIFPQVEQALTTMEVGDQQSVAVESESAFGLRIEELVIDIPRANLPPEPAPELGMALQGQQADGSPVTLYVVAVDDEVVKADANHPLAGEEITFDFTLRAINQAA